MGEIRTVTTLIKKRDEIRATIRMDEKKITQARSDHRARDRRIVQLVTLTGV